MQSSHRLQFQYLRLRSLPLSASSSTLFASCKVAMVAPFIELWSFDTRYSISGLACLDIHERLPTTESSCRSSPRTTRSECFRFAFTSMYVILLVLSVPSKVRHPLFSNCLLQNLNRPCSRHPASNFVSSLPMILPPPLMDARKQSAT